jgi:broad specificity phosphatase PhoE
MSAPELVVDLIRHAESHMNVAMADPNRVPFIGGRENHVGLSPLGERQAETLGHFALVNGIQPTELYCSPAVRSRRTCEISAAIMGLTLPVNVDDRLQELDQGD